ncbi:MAG: multicopper oxidase domain-containing protein, partial [Cuspidothrix sp.]
MSDNFPLSQDKIWTRRHLLKLGVFGAGIITAGAFWQTLSSKNHTKVRIPLMEMAAANGATNPMKVLRDFDYGTIKQENGRIIREFELVAGTSTIQLNSAVSYNIWDLNGRIPGPTLRAKEGEKIRILFLNNAGHSHSLHFHGVHPAEMD